MSSKPLLAAILIFVVLASGCIGGKTPTTSTSAPSGNSQTATISPVQISTTLPSVPSWEYRNAKVIRGVTIRDIDFHWQDMGEYAGNVYLTYAKGVVT